MTVIQHSLPALMLGLKTPPKNTPRFSGTLAVEANDVFCQMARKEIPSGIVAENDSFYAVLDIDPLTPGHTVLASKRHIATSDEMTHKEKDDLHKLLETSKRKLVEALNRKGFHPTGWNIGWDEHPVAGQEIGHLHVHLIPRYANGNKGGVRGVIPELQFPSPQRQDFGVFQKLFGDNQ